MHVKATDIAWAAGLFDGEGCFSITVNMTRLSGRPHFMARMFVTNSNRECLYKMRRIFGGRVGPGGSRRSNLHKPSFVWVLSNRSAISVARAMLPYSIVKRKQLRLAVFYYSCMKDKGAGGMGRGIIYSDRDNATKIRIANALSMANKRGIA